MNTSLRLLLPLLVLYGCEIGQSVAPGEANDSPCEQLVEFTCGDSLVVTDLPQRFPIDDNEIAGVWDLTIACGDPGTCWRPGNGGPSVAMAFELSGSYLVCTDDNNLTEGTYEFMPDLDPPTLELSGTPILPASSSLVEFVTPDTLWLHYTFAPGFYSQHVARTYE